MSEETKFERRLVRQSKISPESEITAIKEEGGGHTLSYPEINGESIKGWDVGKILHDINIGLDPRRITQYVDQLKECHTTEEFQAAIGIMDGEIANEIGIHFETRLQAHRATHPVHIPFTETAAEQDLTLAFTMGRVFVRYFVDSIFSDFDQAQWEREFLERRDTRSPDKPYTLQDFFEEKCHQTFASAPVAQLEAAILSEHPERDPETQIEGLIRNFGDGLSHIPHLRKLATSDADLRKRVRYLMHLNASAALTRLLINTAGGHSYFWKPLQTLFEDSLNSQDHLLKLACDPEAPTEMLKGSQPNVTCPVHYLPAPVFNGLVELMIKYPEVTPRKRRSLRDIEGDVD
jgi:hypothetical protein